MERQFKLADIFADIRVDPQELGRMIGRSHLGVQERVFDFTLAFLNELAIQSKMGGYVNGNMEIANRAKEIQEILLTFGGTQE